MQKKAFIERIEPSFGSSYTLKKFDSIINDKKAMWHYHEEIELVFVKESSGTRHIGNHISNFYNGDLIMIGSNLPHLGYADRLLGQGIEYVLQFREDFLGEGLLLKPEFISVKRLFEMAKNGLSFKGNTRTEIGERMESLFYMSNFEKLVEVLKILNILGTSRDYEVLNAGGASLMYTVQGADRLDDVFNHVSENFQDPITVDELANITAMTVPSFCRFFKKQTGKTFIEFLNEYRISHACKLLAESSLPITDVCFDSGFNNFSHFNKYFKRITGKSPSNYRKEMSLTIMSGNL
ncbi:MAG TPA: AraC family transcriptional regulator [Saprospiraceae bacterium]|nr:AraC family transcriptional regulator [Saprospiraceae bacterium]